MKIYEKLIKKEERNKKVTYQNPFLLFFLSTSYIFVTNEN